MIERTQQELGEKLTVVATGGLSSVIAPLTKNIKNIEQLLTLNGLAEICRIVCD
jgi:type III pantothenate kinase